MQENPALEEAVSPALAAPAAAPEPAEAAAVAGGRGPDESHVHAALAVIEAAVAAGFSTVLREFRDKLALDQFKEEQVTRLHDELQAYREERTEKMARQIFQGFIRLHDDLGKTAAALRQKPPEELTAERLFVLLDGFRDDVELVLGQHGVEPFRVPGDAFDPRRQTALRTLPAADPADIGRIAERLRPGFEQGAELLQKERVAVYVASRNMNDHAQGAPS